MLSERDLEQPQVVSVAKAAKILGLGRTAGYNAVARGDLPVIKIGKRLMISVRVLERMLEGEAVAGSGE